MACFFLIFPLAFAHLTYPPKSEISSPLILLPFHSEASQNNDLADKIGNFSLGLLESLVLGFDIEQCRNSLRNMTQTWLEMDAISQRTGYYRDPTSSYSAANSTVSYSQYWPSLLKQYGEVVTTCGLIDIAKVLLALAIKVESWSFELFLVLKYLIFKNDFMIHLYHAISYAQDGQWRLTGFETGEMIKIVSGSLDHVVGSSTESKLVGFGFQNFDDCNPAPWVICSENCCRNIFGSVCCSEPCIDTYISGTPFGLGCCGSAGNKTCIGPTTGPFCCSPKQSCCNDRCCSPMDGDTCCDAGGSGECCRRPGVCYTNTSLNTSYCCSSGRVCPNGLCLPDPNGVCCSSYVCSRDSFCCDNEFLHQCCSIGAKCCKSGCCGGPSYPNAICQANGCCVSGLVCPNGMCLPDPSYFCCGSDLCGPFQYCCPSGCSYSPCDLFELDRDIYTLPLIEWSKAEVQKWLVEVELVEWMFHLKDLDGANLFVLTDEGLQELGILKALDRMKIMKQVVLLKAKEKSTL